MFIADRDRDVLRALMAAREEHKELADLLDFYYDLYEVQFACKSELPFPEVRDDVGMRWRLEGGIPQVAFDQLRLDPAGLADLVQKICAVLLRHNPGWQARATDCEAKTLLPLAQEVFVKWETLTALQRRPPNGGNGGLDSLAALAVALALVPYLQRAAETIVHRLDLALWNRGYCPICGGRPNLALLGADTASRQLVCSRCTTTWSYARIGCPFCGEKEEQRFYPSESGLYRLYVCPVCKQYLKTVDLQHATGPVQPMVERLLTISMDLAAQQQGWGGWDSTAN